jgi:hypothetical protein
MPDRLYADEWLPSRFSLGILRLLTFALSRGLEKRRPSSGARLNRDRHQHPLEAYVLGLAYWLIPTLHLTLLAGTAWGPRPVVWPLAFAIGLVAVPQAWVLLALLLTPFASAASKISGRPTHDIQALATPIGMLGIAAASVMLDWPGAVLGWLWIGLTVVEIFATLLCIPLRRRFAALEQRLQTEAV